MVTMANNRLPVIACFLVEGIRQVHHVLAATGRPYPSELLRYISRLAHEFDDIVNPEPQPFPGQLALKRDPEPALPVPAPPSYELGPNVFLTPRSTRSYHRYRTCAALTHSMIAKHISIVEAVIEGFHTCGHCEKRLMSFGKKRALEESHSSEEDDA